MNLTFRHSGLQFFFITLTLEGRPPMLSRLVEGEAHPVLLPAGEVVQAYLRAFHAVYPAVTISDRVIMPDHVHFLMIVRYDQAPGFNPLWASFALMKAIEAAEAQRNGGDAPAPPEAAVHFAEILAHERATAAQIERFMHQGLTRAEALARLGALRAQPTPLQGVRGAQSPVRSALRFDRRAYIELSFDARQLKAIRRYIQLNPARALWKHHHPDRFLRITNIRHAILDPAHVWSAMGNLTLLGSPFLVHARLTLKKSLAEHAPALAEFVEKARRGAVIVSGFISPGEVELLKRLKATPNARFVKMLPCALPPRYDPSAEDSRELAADRMLILSSFTNTTPHISARAMRRDPAAAHLFRANCLAMNALAATLCEKARARA